MAHSFILQIFKKRLLTLMKQVLHSPFQDVPQASATSAGTLLLSLGGGVLEVNTPRNSSQPMTNGSWGSLSWQVGNY